VEGRRGDIFDFDGHSYAGADLLSGGVPCTPFTVSGQQLGVDDDRNLFGQALRLTEEIRPRSVLFENVPGLSTAKFDSYRGQILARLHDLGYRTWWQVIQASDFGVPQLRPRFVLVGIKEPWAAAFRWPAASSTPPETVGATLHDLMAARGWTGARAWADGANGIAPTLVGGSEKHGGADLGPSRSKAAWAVLGIDGWGVADEPPGPDGREYGLRRPRKDRGLGPMLTTRMCARIQGFPDEWEFAGKKTSIYEQVGNAWCPPVARAVGLAIRAALESA